MIKAIFFDVDGTLLSHRTGRISPHTRACIRALRAGGTLVFLSTGRTFWSCGASRWGRWRLMAISP